MVIEQFDKNRLEGLPAKKIARLRRLVEIVVNQADMDGLRSQLPIIKVPKYDLRDFDEHEINDIIKKLNKIFGHKIISNIIEDRLSEFRLSLFANVPPSSMVHRYVEMEREHELERVWPELQALYSLEQSDPKNYLILSISTKSDFNKLNSLISGAEDELTTVEFYYSQKAPQIICGDKKYKPQDKHKDLLIKIGFHFSDPDPLVIGKPFKPDLGGDSLTQRKIHQDFKHKVLRNINRQLSAKEIPIRLDFNNGNLLVLPTTKNVRVIYK